MTKKQFVLLAEKLKAMRPSGENKYAGTKAKYIAKGKFDQWFEMVKGMADFCASQNENFDYDRFMAAVTVPSLSLSEESDIVKIEFLDEEKS